jgi:hypothetical protein
MSGHTNLDVTTIVEAYRNGESASSIARRSQVSVWSVITRLRKAGIDIRANQQERRLDLTPGPFKEFRALVDGLLLGDGSIGRKGELRLHEAGCC